MGVRVRIRIKSRSSGIEVETSALVNSGYEVNEPEILLPRRLAEYLGLPLRPPRVRVLIYETPMGLYNLLFVEREVEVHLIDLCRKVDDVNVAIADHEREVLLSDKLSSMLGIQILDIASGIWRHVDDGLNVKRKSTSPEYW